ncbi:MAG: hypothetical protein KBA26_05760 [Candidatus Delongbacteria bacterium]|nr:hypothetical protein [Candidatus Delongbacteria bacterium]
MWKKSDAIERHQVLVISNGQQAPYGDGELIQAFPATRAGMREAKNLADQWYNRPFIINPKSE